MHFVHQMSNKNKEIRRKMFPENKNELRSSRPQFVFEYSFCVFVRSLIALFVAGAEAHYLV